MECVRKCKYNECFAPRSKDFEARRLRLRESDETIMKVFTLKRAHDFVPLCDDVAAPLFGVGKGPPGSLIPVIGGCAYRTDESLERSSGSNLFVVSTRALPTAFAPTSHAPKDCRLHLIASFLGLIMIDRSIGARDGAAVDFLG